MDSKSNAGVPANIPLPSPARTQGWAVLDTGVRVLLTGRAVLWPKVRADTEDFGAKFLHQFTTIGLYTEKYWATLH